MKENEKSCESCFNNIITQSKNCAMCSTPALVYWQPVPAEQEQTEKCNLGHFNCRKPMKECPECPHYSIEQPAEQGLEEAAKEYFKEHERTELFLTAQVITESVCFAKYSAVRDYHQKGLFTKEQVLKAAELGEVNHFDAEHIVSLLDEIKGK